MTSVFSSPFSLRRLVAAAENRALRKSALLFVLCVQETWYWPGVVGADAVVMSGVRCSGTEMSLSHCLHHGAHLNCPKGGGRHAAGVSCSESKRTESVPTPWTLSPAFLLLCFPSVRSGSRPGAQPSGGGADHLHGGPAHVHAAVRLRGELPGLRLQPDARHLLPPPAALLLADPQQRPVRLPAQSRTTLVGLARLSQVAS